MNNAIFIAKIGSETEIVEEEVSITVRTLDLGHNFVDFVPTTMKKVLGVTGIVVTKSTSPQATATGNHYIEVAGFTAMNSWRLNYNPVTISDSKATIEFWSRGGYDKDTTFKATLVGIKK